MIHVADARLVRLIALGKKTTHRFPANYKPGTQDVTNPKIRPGIVHRVYMKAPFGKDGDPDAKPLLLVDVKSVTLDVLCDTTDEDVREEGFASLETFIKYWNNKWARKSLRYHIHMYHPIWVVRFKLKEILPAGQKIIDILERKNQKHGNTSRSLKKTKSPSLST